MFKSLWATFQCYKDPVLLVSLFILRSNFQNNLLAGKKLKIRKISFKAYFVISFLKNTTFSKLQRSVTHELENIALILQSTEI